MSASEGKPYMTSTNAKAVDGRLYRDRREAAARQFCG
jgi:hypothetical protein